MSAVIISQTGSNGGLCYYGSSSRMLQTFTIPAGIDTIDKVELELKEVGSMPGNLRVEIFATSGGNPTGSALRTVNLTSGNIGSSYGMVSVAFSALTVTAGAKYAIVVTEASVSSLSNASFWNHYDSSGLGSAESKYSSNSGSSWTSLSGDFTFKVWGYTSATAPTGVTTDSTANLTATSVDVNGTIGADGGSTITERGAVYSSTNTTPTTADSKKIVAGTTGACVASLTGLTTGVTYYVRTYAKNAIGTTYGAVLSITTTNAAPTVVLNSITNIDSVSAIGNANVTSENGATVIERGIVWKTSTGPTTSDNKIVAGSGPGVFSASMATPAMTPNTTYYARAYAINSIGTSYSNEISFTTLDQFLRWAQSFAATATGTLTKISLLCKLGFGTSGSLQIKIAADSAGSPGTILQTLPAVTITNTDFAWIDIVTNVAVTNGSSYWIIVEAPLSIGVFEIYIGSSNTSVYAGGETKYQKASAPSTWAKAAPYATTDMAFYAYIQPTIGANYTLEVTSKKMYK